VAGSDLHSADNVNDLARVLPFMGGLFEALAGLGGSLQGGAEALMARSQEYMEESKGKVADKKRWVAWAGRG
jgi:hypothetical protein